MSGSDVPIKFSEYADPELPELLRTQVLDFLRIVWPDGFTGENRFRDVITDPTMNPYHLVYVAGSQLVSHLEIVTTTVSVNGNEYLVKSPTSVLTYPAFRGEGWSSRLNARAAATIDASGADMGILTCGPHLIDFYGRFGWAYASGVSVVVGSGEETWTSDDVLMTRPTSPSSARFLRDIKHHPVRTIDLW